MQMNHQGQRNRKNDEKGRKRDSAGVVGASVLMYLELRSCDTEETEGIGCHFAGSLGFGTVTITSITCSIDSIGRHGSASCARSSLTGFPRPGPARCALRCIF